MPAPITLPYTTTPANSNPRQPVGTFELLNKSIMKRTTTISVIIFWMFSTALMGQLEIPHLKVYGTAETKVVPDQLTWRISIETPGPVVEQLAKIHLEEVKAVLEYLRGSGVVEKTLKTTHMQLKENWVYRNKNRVQDGYYAYTTVTFKTEEYGSYTRHWIALTKLKNVSIENVDYDISNRIEIRNETRTNAIIAARKKAEKMADDLGVELAEPFSLEEYYPEAYVSGFMGNYAGESGSSGRGGGSISPGTESISVRVELVYRILSK